MGYKLTKSISFGRAVVYVMFAAFLTVSISFITSCSSEKKNQKPNIVLIVIDDMGWGDIGYNSDDIRSPNLDKLAGEGVTFTQFYSNPECTPTRVSLITGRFPTRFGLHCSSASNDQAFPFGTETWLRSLKAKATIPPYQGNGILVLF